MQLDLPMRLDRKNWLMGFTLALIILLSYYIWLLDGLVLGLVFAYVGRPVRDLFGKRRRIGSLAAIICIVVPLSAIFATGVIEASKQIIWLESHEKVIISSSLNWSPASISHKRYSMKSRGAWPI